MNIDTVKILVTDNDVGVVVVVSVGNCTVI
jgi:hypothetical protein